MTICDYSDQANRLKTAVLSVLVRASFRDDWRKNRLVATPNTN